MKRLAIFIGVPMVLILGFVCLFFLCFYLYFSRDIAPPDVSDLVLERVNVADADNAFTYFNEAAAATDWPKDDKFIREIFKAKKNDPTYVAELLARNKKALEILNRGLECNICQMPEIKRIDDLCKYLEDWRTLSRLLWLKAMNDREAGRWEESTEACHKLIRLGDLVQKNPNGLICHLVGAHIMNQGFDASRRLATSSEIPEEELERLAKVLTQIEPLNQGLAKALKAEYQTISNTIDALLEGTISLDSEELDDNSYRHAGYSFQPNRTKEMFADEIRTFLYNLDLSADGWSTVLFRKPPDNEKQKFILSLTPNSAGHFFVAEMAGASYVVREAKDRCLGELAATQLIVACRRYEQDHSDLPSTLDDLVPRYLDAVPIDPFDGLPMRYDSKRAMVYTVNKDMIDSGGSDRLTPEAPVDDGKFSHWGDEDAVFYIHGRPKINKQNDLQQPVGQALPDKKTIKHAQ